MFPLRSYGGKGWCTQCAMTEFEGIQRVDCTAENVTAFIERMRLDGVTDHRGHIVKEFPVSQVREESRCTGCNALLLPLLQAPMGSIQRNWLFTVVDDAWVPRERERLVTDLNATWDRKLFEPFESVQLLARNMRVLVIDEVGKEHFGSLLYATETEVVIEYDEKRRGRDHSDIVFYPKTYPGLYLDLELDTQYRAICTVEHFSFSRLSEQERQEQHIPPYAGAWKVINIPLEINIFADTKRQAIEEVYLTLVNWGLINDPTPTRPAGNGLPF